MSATAARLVQIAKDLHTDGEDALAQFVLEDAERRFPHDVEVLLNLANVLWLSKQPERALAVCLRAKEFAPDDPGMHYNIAMMAGWTGAFAMESASLERLVAHAPADAQLRFRLAESLDRQGRFHEAIESYERAAALSGNEPLHHIHLGYALLRQGDWARGWDEMGWYWRPEGMEKYFRAGVGAPRGMVQAGDSVAGKKLLMTGWGGAGDLVMFARMASKLVERGAAGVTLHVDQARFFAANRWGFPVVTPASAAESAAVFEQHDAWIPGPRVPAVLGLGPSDVACEPYFLPDPALQATWRARIGERGPRMKVGLAWSGNPSNIYEHNRSVSTRVLPDLIEGAPVDWYVVQKNARNAELSQLGLPHVHDFSADCTDLAELAALCSQLDLVISVDSLPAHLAGSIGVPTWLLLCKAADWRWGVDGDATPWYGSMRIFRQRTLGDWPEVLQRVRRELAGKQG